MGGPVQYTPHDGSNVRDAWILQNVVMHIQQCFSAQFTLTLAPPNHLDMLQQPNNNSSSRFSQK